MKAEKKLKLSIEALDNFGVSPEIIKDMLNDLNQVLLDKKSEKIAKEHFRKQRDKCLIELQHYTKYTAVDFANYYADMVMAAYNRDADFDLFAKFLEELKKRQDVKAEIKKR